MAGELPSSRSRRSNRPTTFRRLITLRRNEIKKNVSELKAADLMAIVKALHKYGLISLHLIQAHPDLQAKNAEKNLKLNLLNSRHSEPLFRFTRALSWGLCGGGFLQDLELGICLWQRDLKILAEGIGQSSKLKRLSFANSGLGNQNLQLLGKGLKDCSTLEVLNLSACCLTDGVAPLLGSILKANLCRKAQADWQASLRSSRGVIGVTLQEKGLAALDISFNSFTDTSTQEICNVLKIGPPLEALNFKNNQLSRNSGKMLLEVMDEWGILRFVDLRNNVDDTLMGVLEDGEHLTAFSQPHPPFWTSPPSLEKKKAVEKRVIKNLAKETQISLRSTPREEIFLQPDMASHQTALSSTTNGDQRKCKKPFHRSRSATECIDREIKEATSVGKVNSSKIKALQLWQGSAQENKHRIHKEAQKRRFLKDCQLSIIPSALENSMKMSEWNLFIEEITESLLHLQDQLDKFIGPADPNSMSAQVASRLRMVAAGK